MTVKYEKLWEMAHRTVKKRKKTFSASDTCTWLWIKNEVKNVLRWTATEYKQIKQEAWIWKSCIWVKTHTEWTHTHKFITTRKKRRKCSREKKSDNSAKLNWFFFSTISLCTIVKHFQRRENEMMFGMHTEFFALVLHSLMCAQVFVIQISLARGKSEMGEHTV